MTESVAAPRLKAVDLARGIALLGVALVNVHAFAAVWSSLYGLDLARSAADVVAETVNAMLFTHRSYPVLSFLFGAGLAWQWSHLPEPTRQPRHLRPRLWALLAIGVAHGLLLWPGDVLTAYALMGLVIVALLKRSNRVILGAAIAAYVFTVLLYTSLGVGMVTAPALPFAVDEPLASFAAATWREALSRRLGEYWQRGLVQLFVTDFWAHALLGMWAARTGALQRFFAAPFARLSVVIAGFVLLLAGSGVELYAARFGGWNASTFDDRGGGMMAIALLPASMGGLWLWLTVAACWSRSRFAHGVLASFIIAAGRAPLSQFIGQSLIFAVVFSKSLIGWHGELGRGTYSLIALLTYVMLCGFLRAWAVSGHAHGPMEMLWRGLTMRLSPPPALPATATRATSSSPTSP